MAAQAGRFGQAGLARAAEIVSTGLDQMRGATSSRLLLELMCAQVLLPAATTDEKSLLARLERLEAGGRGTSAPLPQSPPSPPHSGTDDFPERTRVPAPPDRKAAARPAETAAPVPAAAEPAKPAGVPPAAGSASGAAGSSSADSLRKNWDAILEAVMQERKVAWLLLRNASVLSLEDKVLTLRFPRDGDLKGFGVSGHDAILRRVLNTRFGLDVTIRGVTGADPVTGPVRAAGPASPGPAAASDPVTAAPSRSRPRHDEPPPDEIASDEFGPDEPDDMPPDEADGGRAPVVTELTGMDLIQRELGGQVIGEIDD
jgi:DNA polymerase-3 subunit gamma/tau